MGWNKDYAEQVKAGIRENNLAVSEAVRNSKDKRKAGGADLFTAGFELASSATQLASLVSYQAAAIDGLEKRVGELEGEAYEKRLAEKAMIPNAIEVTDERSTAGRVADFAVELSEEGAPFEMIGELTLEFLRQLMAGVMRNETDLELIYSPAPEVEDSEVVTPILKPTA